MKTCYILLAFLLQALFVASNATGCPGNNAIYYETGDNATCSCGGKLCGVGQYCDSSTTICVTGDCAYCSACVNDADTCHTTCEAENQQIANTDAYIKGKGGENIFYFRILAPFIIIFPGIICYLLVVLKCCHGSGKNKIKDDDDSKLEKHVLQKIELYVVNQDSFPIKHCKQYILQVPENAKPTDEEENNSELEENVKKYKKYNNFQYLNNVIKEKLKYVIEKGGILFGKVHSNEGEILIDNDMLDTFIQQKNEKDDAKNDENGETEIKPVYYIKVMLLLPQSQYDKTESKELEYLEDDSALWAIPEQYMEYGPEKSKSYVMKPKGTNQFEVFLLFLATLAISIGVIIELQIVNSRGIALLSGFGVALFFLILQASLAIFFGRRKIGENSKKKNVQQNKIGYVIMEKLMRYIFTVVGCFMLISLVYQPLNDPNIIIIGKTSTIKIHAPLCTLIINPSKYLAREFSLQNYALTNSMVLKLDTPSTDPFQSNSYYFETNAIKGTYTVKKSVDITQGESANIGDIFQVGKESEKYANRTQSDSQKILNQTLGSQSCFLTLYIPHHLDVPLSIVQENIVLDMDEVSLSNVTLEATGALTVVDITNSKVKHLHISSPALELHVRNSTIVQSANIKANEVNGFAELLLRGGATALLLHKENVKHGLICLKASNVMSSTQGLDNDTITFISPSLNVHKQNVLEQNKVFFSISDMQKGYFVMDMSEDQCSELPSYNIKKDIADPAVNLEDSERIVFQTKRNDIVRFQIGSYGVSPGTWVFATSQAYLLFSTSYLSTISLGMLAPIQSHVYARTNPLSSCSNELTWTSDTDKLIQTARIVSPMLKLASSPDRPLSSNFINENDGVIYDMTEETLEQRRWSNDTLIVLCLSIALALMFCTLVVWMYTTIGLAEYRLRKKAVSMTIASNLIDSHSSTDSASAMVRLATAYSIANTLNFYDYVFLELQFDRIAEKEGNLNKKNTKNRRGGKREILVKLGRRNLKRVERAALFGLIIILPSLPTLSIVWVYLQVVDSNLYVHQPMDDYLKEIGFWGLHLSVLTIILDTCEFLTSSRNAFMTPLLKTHYNIPFHFKRMHSFIRTIGYTASLIISANVFLWTLIGVVIKPELAIPVCTAVASIFAHISNMYKQFKEFIDNIEKKQKSFNESIHGKSNDEKQWIASIQKQYQGVKDSKYFEKIYNLQKQLQEGKFNKIFNKVMSKESDKNDDNGVNKTYFFKLIETVRDGIKLTENGSDDVRKLIELYKNHGRQSTAAINADVEKKIMTKIKKNVQKIDQFVKNPAYINTKQKGMENFLKSIKTRMETHASSPTTDQDSEMQDTTNEKNGETSMDVREMLKDTLLILNALIECHTENSKKRSYDSVYIEMSVVLMQIICHDFQKPLEKHQLLKFLGNASTNIIVNQIRQIQGKFIHNMREIDDETKESDDNKNIEKKTLKEISDEFKDTVLKFIDYDHIILLTGKGIEDGTPKSFSEPEREKIMIPLKSIIKMCDRLAQMAENLCPSSNHELQEINKILDNELRKHGITRFQAMLQIIYSVFLLILIFILIFVAQRAFGFQSLASGIVTSLLCSGSTAGFSYVASETLVEKKKSDLGPKGKITGNINKKIGGKGFPPLVDAPKTTVAPKVRPKIPPPAPPFQDDFESLKKKFEEIVKIQAFLKKRNKELEINAEVMRSRVVKIEEDHNTEINKLNKDHSTEINKLNEDHSTEINKLNKDHSTEINKLNEDHSTEMNKLNSAFDKAFKDEIDKLRKAFKKVQEEHEKNKKIIDTTDLEEQMTGLESKQNENKKDVENLEEKWRKLNVDYATLKQDHGKSKEMINKLTTDNKTLTDEKIELEIDNKKLAETIGKQKVEIERLTKQLEDHVPDCKTKIKDLNTKVTELQEKIANAKNKWKTIHASLTQKNKTQEITIKDLIKKIKDIESSNETRPATNPVPTNTVPTNTVGTNTEGTYPVPTNTVGTNTEAINTVPKNPVQTNSEKIPCNKCQELTQNYQELQSNFDKFKQDCVANHTNIRIKPGLFGCFKSSNGVGKDSNIKPLPESNPADDDKIRKLEKKIKDLEATIEELEKKIKELEVKEEPNIIPPGTPKLPEIVPEKCKKCKKMKKKYKQNINRLNDEISVLKHEHSELLGKIGDLKRDHDESKIIIEQQLSVAADKWKEINDKYESAKIIIEEHKKCEAAIQKLNKRNNQHHQNMKELVYSVYDIMDHLDTSEWQLRVFKADRNIRMRLPTVLVSNKTLTQLDKAIFLNDSAGLNETLKKKFDEAVNGDGLDEALRNIMAEWEAEKEKKIKDLQSGNGKIKAILQEYEDVWKPGQKIISLEENLLEMRLGRMLQPPSINFLRFVVRYLNSTNYWEEDRQYQGLKHNEGSSTDTDGKLVKRTMSFAKQFLEEDTKMKIWKKKTVEFLDELYLLHNECMNNHENFNDDSNEWRKWDYASHKMEQFILYQGHKHLEVRFNHYNKLYQVLTANHMVPLGVCRQDDFNKRMINIKDFVVKRTLSDYVVRTKTNISSPGLPPEYVLYEDVNFDVRVSSTIVILFGILITPYPMDYVEQCPKEKEATESLKKTRFWPRFENDIDKHNVHYKPWRLRHPPLSCGVNRDCNKHPQLYTGKDHMNNTTSWYDAITKTKVTAEGEITGDLKDYIQWYIKADKIAENARERAMSEQQSSPVASPRKRSQENEIKEKWEPFYNIYHNHQFPKWCHRKFDEIRKNARKDLESNELVEKGQDLEDARKAMNKRNEYDRALNLEQFDDKVESIRKKNIEKFGEYYNDIKLGKDEIKTYIRHAQKIVLAELQNLLKYIQDEVAKNPTILEEFCTKFLELDSILRFIFDLPWHKWFSDIIPDEDVLVLPGQERKKSMQEVVLDEQFKQNLLKLVEVCDLPQFKKKDFKKS